MRQAGIWFGVVIGLLTAGAALCAEDKIPDTGRHDPRLDQLVNMQMALR